MHILHSNHDIKIRNSLVLCYLGSAFALHSEDKLELLPPYKLSILVSRVLLHTAEARTQGCVYSQTSRSLPDNLYLINSNASFRRSLQSRCRYRQPCAAARRAGNSAVTGRRTVQLPEALLETPYASSWSISKLK